jgi:nitric oxide reductase NorD protein
MIAPALTEAELDQTLDYLLSPVLSSRRTTAQPAQALAPLARPKQDLVLHWIEVIAHTNYEMAYQFAVAAPAALARLDESALETWIIQAMDPYDREGLHRGGQVFKQIATWTQVAAGIQIATFEERAHVLDLFVCGLAGRHLKLDTANESWTDTETLYLPTHIAALPTKAENFRIYKILATLLWAQGRYGTFHADLEAACAAFAEPARATALLAYLESLRLEARISHALPGIARDLVALRGGAIDERCTALTLPSATVHDSLKLLNQFYGTIDAPRHAWRTTLRPEAHRVRDARIQREQNALAAALTELAHELDAGSEPAAQTLERFQIQAAADTSNDGGRLEFELQFDGAPLAPPDHVTQLIDSILQDLGDIPGDYLRGAYDASARDDTDSTGIDPADTAKDIAREDGAHFYNEWDHKRRHYRKNWCVLRELDVLPVTNNFVADTLAKYRPQIAELRRTFEVLRGEEKMLKRQAVGDDIDFDSLVAAYADLQSGHELSDRLLTRHHKNERDLAVLFMVDMSGSTKGWINDAERESLVMLCEALEVLGDRYAIYGFSGLTRQRCEIYRIKRFDEAYDDAVRQRIAGITPQDYTRMGAAIRHLTKLLNGIDARTKLLITLSDGKPDDYSDNYRGDYGIEDTRQALIEAHRSGVIPFCITINSEARDYLPHLYGPVNWALVDDVIRLPLKVADIYRRLTT